MQALVHNQLSAPKFENPIKSAWHKSGYTDENPGEVLNVNKVCFSVNCEKCETSGCNEFCFIECASCSKYLCFNDFFY